MEETNIAPTASATFGRGWETLKKNFPELLLILLIIGLFSLPIGLVNAFAEKDSFGNLFFTLFNVVYGLAVMAPLSYGADLLCLKAVRGTPFNVNEIFEAYRQTLQIILANVLVGAVVALGFVMLIVPGIIFACKLSMVPYLVMDQKMDAIAAVRKSWEMTTGFSWTIFYMGFLSCLIFLAGICMVIVGVFPAIILINLAFASMYHGILTEQVSKTQSTQSL